MKKKRLRCILCNGTDRVIPREEGYGLCEDCEKTCDWWNGFPVQETEPDRCPICGSRHIETGLMPDEAEFDDDLATRCGWGEVDLNESEANYDAYTYVYEEMACDDESHQDDVEIRIGYGQRYYWNPVSGNYDAAKPLTPTERIQAENAQQEAAGQLRLPVEGLV